MDEDKKKSTLRMIPYGIYVMTAKDGDGNVGAGTAIGSHNRRLTRPWSRSP